MRDDQSDSSEWREYGQGGTSFYLFGHCISFASFQGAADYFDGSAKRTRSGLSGPSGMNWNSIKPA
jgi:hypothetical protein